MDALKAWLGKEARRQERAVYLEDALMGGRFGAYATYRLRFFLVRTALAATVHALKFGLLLSVFAARDFGLVVLAQAVAGLAAGFWWGALESMRGRVRDLYRSGRPHVIEREVAAWLALSLRVSAAIGIAAIAWGLWRAAAGFGPVEAYILAIAARVALSLPARCYHSGVYAIRRVYRPLEAIVAVEVAGFGAILALWPFLDAWAFPVAAVLTAIASTTLTLLFTGRTYRFLGISPWSHVRAGTARLRRAGGEWFAAGVGHAAMTMDALLVLALIGGAAPAGQGVTLGHLLFLIGPLVRAGFEWAHLFYFDLKRLEVRPMDRVRRGFDRNVGRTSLVIATLLWAWAAAVVIFVTGRVPRTLLALLLLFFLARAALAVRQVRAFVDGRYGLVAASGAALLGGFLGAGLAPTDLARMGLLVAVTGLVTVALVHAWRRGARAGSLPSLPEWTETLAARAGPVRISSARFARQRGEVEVEDGRWRTLRLAEALARRLGPDGAVAIDGARSLVWFERRIDPGAGEWLVREAAGLVGGVSSAVADGGEDAVAAARRLLGASASEAPTDEARLVEEFRASFPRGIVFEPDGPPPPELVAMPSHEKRLVLSAAMEFASDLRPHLRRGRHEVTAYCPGGELRLLFLVGRREAAGARARWRARIRQANLGTPQTVGPPS